MKEKINEIEFKKEIKRLYDMYGKCGKYEFKKYSIYKELNFEYFCKKFGGLKNICKELCIEYDHRAVYKREDIIKMATEIYIRFGEINKTICVENRINSSVVRRLFGSYNNLFKEINAPVNMPRFVTKEELVEDIKNFIEKYQSNSCSLYRKYGKYSCTLINKYGGWEKILIENNIEIISGSKSEKFIESFLNQKNILFYIHHNFEWLKINNCNLYVDFYIPSKNLIIEYNGLQHYKYIPYFHKNEDNFKKRQKYDEFKYTSIINHGIELLIIDYNQDILEILNDIFF